MRTAMPLARLRGRWRMAVFGVVVALLLALVLGRPQHAAGVNDPSQITASCLASNGTTPFSATAPFAVTQGDDVIFQLFYRHNDLAAGAVYNVTFTARIETSAAFGLARDIDTKTLAGGAGLGTGTSSQVRLQAGVFGTGIQGILVRITSDATGSTVLAKCDFILSVEERQDPKGDYDGDGLENELELRGLRDGTGALVVDSRGRAVGNFSALGANPCRKDLFVELDYFAPADGHQDRTSDAAIAQVAQAFNVAPVAAPPPCPFPGFTSQGGVHLVVDADEELPHDIVQAGCRRIEDLKRLTPGREPYFIYALALHAILQSASGLACPQIRSFAVATYGMATRQQAAVFMHELGHLLGLGHGGGDDVNLKPNYFGVMNYSYSSGGVLFADGTFGIDYSRSKLPTLDEAQLLEGVGVQGPASLKTVWWGPNPPLRFGGQSSMPQAANGPLDWNQNGAPDAAAVSVDVNSDGVCVGPGSNRVLNSTPHADDRKVGEEILNGPDHACQSTASLDDVRAAAMMCVRSAVVGQPRQSAPAGDDRGDVWLIDAGENRVCETAATGTDRQVTPVGRSEPLLVGHDDWSGIDWRVGPSRAAPAFGPPLPPVQPHDDLTHAQMLAIERAMLPRSFGDCGGSLTYTPLMSTYTWSNVVVPFGPAGSFMFSARLRNTGTRDLTDLVATIVELNKGNKLLSADNGAGVVGDAYTIAREGAYADGMLGPGEQIDVPHTIGLAVKGWFAFRVNVSCRSGAP